LSTSGGESSTQDVSEEDSTWLKGKADDFYRRGDLESAVNAYSSAIDAALELVPPPIEVLLGCYSNRSLAHLRLDRVTEARLDCSAALSYFRPPPPTSATGSNDGPAENHPVSQDVTGALSTDPYGSSPKGKALFVKLLLRRGMCNCRLGLFGEASADYQEAHDAVLTELPSGSAVRSVGNSPNPHFEADAISRDLKSLRRLMTCDGLKKEADKLFSEGDVAGAWAKYSSALEVLDRHVGCWSNRAACSVALGDLPGCVADCTTALRLLNCVHDEDEQGHVLVNPESRRGGGGGPTVSLSPTSGLSSNLDMLSAVLPPVGSEKHMSWILKTLLRRAVVYVQLGQLDEAISDYGFALSLDPSNEALKSDITKLTNLRAAKGSQTPNT